jgi:hypothetical protein
MRPALKVSGTSSVGIQNEGQRALSGFTGSPCTVGDPHVVTLAIALLDQERTLQIGLDLENLGGVLLFI